MIIKKNGNKRSISVEREKIYVIIAFALLAVGIVMQYRLVGMYFDDFGNASLSYGYDSSNINGTAYSVADLFQWAKWIYFNWGGRVLYALVMIPMLKNGPLPFMMFQSIILLLIFVMMYKMAKRYCGFQNEPFIVLAFVVLYGTLKGTILTWGIYWASASVLYLLPILPFLVCIYIYDSSVNMIKKGNDVPIKSYVLLGILIPWVTLSQEQISGAFLVWIICRIVIRIIVCSTREEKTYLKLDLFIFIWSLITSMIFFLAPGNWSRMNAVEGFSELSVIEKIQVDFPILINILLDRSLAGINVFLWLSGVAMLVMLFMKKKSWVHILLFVGILPFGVYLFNVVLERILGFNILGWIDYKIIFCMFILSMFFILILFFYERKQLQLLALMIAAVASVVCLLISPTINLRSCIPYAFICMLLIVIVGYIFYMTYKNIIVRYICTLLAAGIVVLSAINLAVIYIGYDQNYEAEQKNFDTLSNYNGIDEVIYLQKYANDTYRAPMPCDEGYEGTIYWVQEYFDIPGNVSIVWTE